MIEMFLKYKKKKSTFDKREIHLFFKMHNKFTLLPFEINIF